MKYFTLFWICLLLFLGTGCSSLFSDSTPDSEKALQDAWEYFMMTNYDMALTKFESVVSMDPDNAEAYNGLGWCFLLLNNIESAEQNFNFAVEKGAVSMDPHAGLAAVYVSSDAFNQAISEAEYVLSHEPEYVFAYNSEINYLDMHLILAMAYYHTGDFNSTYNHVIVLDPNIVVDENNPATWILNGHQYDSYAEILLAIIDDIDARFGTLSI